MLRDKLTLLLQKYCLDNRIYIIIFLSCLISIFFAIASFFKIIYLIPLFILLLIIVLLINKIIMIKKQLLKGQTTTIILENYQAYIKKTKESSKVSSILIKLYIQDSKKKIYNYYYLNGNKEVFINYVDIINNAFHLELVLYHNTNIIKNIIADYQELDDLYSEYKFSKKLKNKIIYQHYKLNKDVKAVYEYVAYDIMDVKKVFENSNLYEELWILNTYNKYAVISFDQTNNKYFYLDEMIFTSFDDLKNELEKYNFIDNNKVLVIYTLDKSIPSSFRSIIDEISLDN